jgi:hypothetical protein
MFLWNIVSCVCPSSDPPDNGNMMSVISIILTHPHRSVSLPKHIKYVGDKRYDVDRNRWNYHNHCKQSRHQNHNVCLRLSTKQSKVNNNNSPRIPTKSFSRTLERTLSNLSISLKRGCEVFGGAILYNHEGCLATTCPKKVSVCFFTSFDVDRIPSNIL